MSWTAASMVLLGAAVGAGFWWWERSRPPSRLLALVATLAALAALGRIAFAPLPNVKPTTDIVLFAGYALGGAPGFVVGAVAALASNLFFGQGPWTPWQMAGWGGVGLLGAGLAAATRGRVLGRLPLAVACGVAGLAFGAVMNVSMWVTYGAEHSLVELAAYSATSLPFDLAHAAGNVAFCLAFGPMLVAALGRFRARLEVDWRPVAGAAAAVGALAAVPLAAPPEVAAAAVPRGPVTYLERAQNPDGGFGAAPRPPSSPLHTAWAALGLAAAGHNPLDVRRGDASAVDHLEAAAAGIRDLGGIERTLLVLGAAGRDPRSFAGRDLLAELLRRQRRDGSWARRVNTTAFAVLALRAVGRSPRARAVRRGARWIARQANPDGGFNFAGRGGASGVDDTGAGLQALAAAGRRRTATARRAARFLVRSQNPDGGFPLLPGGASNAQSTAWALQGLLAAGRDPDRVRRDGSRTPRGYLRSLIAPSGAVRYSRTSAQTPVWVTGQALLALAEAPFPLRRVPRARRAAAPASSPAPAPTAPTAARTARRPRRPTKPAASPAPREARPDRAQPRRRERTGGGPRVHARADGRLDEATAAAIARRAGELAGTVGGVLL